MWLSLFLLKPIIKAKRLLLLSLVKKNTHVIDQKKKANAQSQRHCSSVLSKPYDNQRSPRKEIQGFNSTHLILFNTPPTHSLTYTFSYILPCKTWCNSHSGVVSTEKGNFCRFKKKKDLKFQSLLCVAPLSAVVSTYKLRCVRVRRKKITFPTRLVRLAYRRLTHSRPQPHRSSIWSSGFSCSVFNFAMALNATTRFSDNYELKEELGKWVTIYFFF